MDMEREKEIRQRMERRYAIRAEFFSHFIAYMVFNGVLWAFFLDIRTLMDGGWSALGVLLTGGWSIGIAIHFVQYYFSEMRERAIQQAIDRERKLYYSKAKRLVRLNDEGELEDFETYADQKQKNRH
jgi:fatty acid desaturase